MKKAFTLIELIITIVIIGIAASALPAMIAGANKLEEETVNQDVFFKSITVITDIASRYWDANIAAQDALGNGAMVVSVQNTNPLFTDSLLATRPGSFNRTENDFRKFYSPTVNASTIQSTNTTQISSTDKLESIDAYNARPIDETTTNAKVRYNIAVVYVPDVVTNSTAVNQTATWNLSGGGTNGAGNTDTNLKRITITASGRTANGQDMSVNFVYFSSNIGTPGIKKQ